MIELGPAKLDIFQQRVKEISPRPHTMHRAIYTSDLYPMRLTR